MEEERIKLSLEQLPTISFRNKKIIDFYNLTGCEIDYSYKNINGTIKIIKTYIKGKVRRIVFENNREVFDVNYDTSFIKGNFTRKIVGSSYRFNIGETVNGLQILNHEIRQINEIAKRKFYLVKCIKCGYISEKWKEEQSIIKGNKCPVCCNAPKVVLDGINDITTTDPWMIPYFQGGYEEAKQYTSGSNKRIFPTCPYCKTIKDKSIKISSIRTNHGISCVCGDGFSYPNKLMYNILLSKSIQFISEYSPEWLEKYRYDFYVPSENIIIEMDGGLGHGKRVMSTISHSRRKISLEETIYRDNMKDILAKENGYTVIRIDCDYSSDIEERFETVTRSILDSQLSNIFDLKDINFKEIDIFCFNNSYIIDIARLWNDKLPISQIEKEMKLSSVTVGKYLKICAKLGLCDYSKEKSINRGLGKTNRRVPYLVLCNDIIQVFSSFSEMQRFYDKNYNIKLYRESVVRYINNNELYLGRKFSRITKEEFNKYYNNKSLANIVIGESFLIA